MIEKPLNAAVTPYHRYYLYQESLQLDKIVTVIEHLEQSLRHHHKQEQQQQCPSWCNDDLKVKLFRDPDKADICGTILYVLHIDGGGGGGLGVIWSLKISEHNERRRR